MQLLKEPLQGTKISNHVFLELVIHEIRILRRIVEDGLNMKVTLVDRRGAFEEDEDADAFLGAITIYHCTQYLNAK